MEEILEQVQDLDLNWKQCLEMKKSVIEILERKFNDCIINWFVSRYKITEHFDILSDVVEAKFEKSHFIENGSAYTFQIPSKPNPEGWETYIYVYVNNEDTKVIDIEYETDRYFVYKHSEHGSSNVSPYGDYQDYPLDDYYLCQPEMRDCIKDQVIEVKKLCALLIDVKV
jgi:hypothetical protein